MRNFLLTGHGRSGTHYMSALFKWFGIDVGLYSNGNDGASHHFPFHKLCDWPFSRVRERYKYLIHYVRDPLKVVESTYLHKEGIKCVKSLVGETSSKIEEINDGSELEISIRSVVLWNRAIADAKPDLCVKVEEAPTALKKWLTENGFELSQTKAPEPATDTNKRTRGQWHVGASVPWSEVSDPVRDMIKKHCREYGYPEKPI